MNFSRRLLIYVVLFVTLNVYTFGFSSLTNWIFDLIGIIGDVETQNIAPFLAAIIVCFPIWIFLWKFSNKSVQKIPEEEFSTLRNLYLNVVSGISLIYISVSIFNLIQSALKIESPLSSLPNLIVWVPIFLLHIKYAQLNWEGDNRKRIHDFYLNIVFLISLIIIFISLSGIFQNIFEYLLVTISQNDLIVGSPEKLSIGQGVISALLTGLILWLYSWNLRIKKLDINFRTVDLSVITISQSFIFLFSIFIILTQSIFIIFNNFGNSSESLSLYKRLEFLPEILSFTVVSMFLWSYYSSGFLDTKVRKLYEINSKVIKWAYRYSIRAIGVVFLISSSVSMLVFLIGIPIVFSEQNLTQNNNWEFQILSASISAFIIGSLTLRYINSKIEKDNDINGQSVQKSYIYLIAIFFAFLLIGALIAILTIFIRDFISWSFGLSTLELIRWPLSFAINSIFILFFYRKSIISRFKSNNDEIKAQKIINVISYKNLEKYKKNISIDYKLKTWRNSENVLKFKSNKKGLEELNNSLNNLNNVYEFYIVEDSNGDILLYYYKK